MLSQIYRPNLNYQASPDKAVTKTMIKYFSKQVSCSLTNGTRIKKYQTDLIDLIRIAPKIFYSKISPAKRIREPFAEQLAWQTWCQNHQIQLKAMQPFCLKNKIGKQLELTGLIIKTETLISQTFLENTLNKLTAYLHHYPIKAVRRFEFEIYQNAPKNEMLLIITNHQ